MAANKTSTGYYSTGDCSTGYCSTGDYSTGYRSTGDCSTGNFSTGNFSVGHFSTKDYAPHGWFNQPSEVRWSEVELPSFLNFRLTEWVGSDKLSEQERADNQSHETTGGYVKIYTYHEAWANYWATLSEDEKKMFEALPHFDADIFEEITGIDVRKEKQVPLEVFIDGIRYVKEEAKCTGL